MEQVNVLFKPKKAVASYIEEPKAITRGLDTLKVNHKKRKVKEIRRNRILAVIALFSLTITSAVVTFHAFAGDQSIEVKKQKVEKQEIEKVDQQTEKSLKVDSKIKIVIPSVHKKMMGEDKFIGMAKGMVNQMGLNPPAYVYHNAYVNGIEKGVPPFLLLGIGWKESVFRPNVTGPETKYGTARGMYQFIESTARQLGFKPNDMYNPNTAATAAAMLINEYSKDFTGHIGKVHVPNSFVNFKTDGQYALYKRNGKYVSVTDQNGQKIPRLLLATMSYNCGPGKISAAMDAYGKVYVDPTSPNRSLPMQTLAYVKLINQYYYNFGYHFTYTIDQVDMQMAANNQ